MLRVICKSAYPFVGQRTCPAIVVACSQFGYQRGLSKLLKALGYNTADEVKVPGGIKMLTKDGPGRGMMRPWLKFLCKEHCAGYIVLVAHSLKCAAYVKDGEEFPDPQQEKIFHEQELKAARELIKASIKDSRVLLVYANAGENGRPRVEFIEIT